MGSGGGVERDSLPETVLAEKLERGLRCARGGARQAWAWEGRAAVRAVAVGAAAWARAHSHGLQVAKREGERRGRALPSIQPRC